MMKLRIFQVNTSKTYICDEGKSFWECMFLSYVVKRTGQGNTGILVRIYSQVKVHHKHETQSDWGTVNKEGLGHLDEFNVSFSCRIHKVNLQLKKKCDFMYQLKYSGYGAFNFFMDSTHAHSYIKNALLLYLHVLSK